jgi:hypothetical protein
MLVNLGAAARAGDICQGLALCRGTTHCTSVRTSGVAICAKCLQIGVRKVIGAESLPLRQPTLQYPTPLFAIPEIPVGSLWLSASMIVKVVQPQRIEHILNVSVRWRRLG